MSQKINNSSTSKVDSLYQLSKSLIRDDASKFIPLINKQISISKMNDYHDGIARAYYLLAYYYDSSHKLDKAAENYFQCLKYSKKYMLGKFIYNSLFNLGRIYFLTA